MHGAHHDLNSMIRLGLHVCLCYRVISASVVRCEAWEVSERCLFSIPESRQWNIPLLSNTDLYRQPEKLFAACEHCWKKTDETIRCEDGRAGMTSDQLTLPQWHSSRYHRTHVLAPSPRSRRRENGSVKLCCRQPTWSTRFVLTLGAIFWQIDSARDMWDIVTSL